MSDHSEKLLQELELIKMNKSQYDPDEYIFKLISIRTELEEEVLTIPITSNKKKTLELLGLKFIS